MPKLKVEGVCGKDSNIKCILTNKLPVGTSTNLNLHIPPITENFDFGTALVNVYPILNIVFDYLNAHDLKTCQEVNESWSYVSQKVLALRELETRWFRLRSGNKDVRCNHQESRILPSIAVCLFHVKRISLEHKICQHPDNLPHFDRISFAEYIRTELLTQSDFLLLGCPRIGSYFDLTYVTNLFEGIELPQIPNIRNVIFTFNKNDLATKVLENVLKPDEEIQCLLLFHSGCAQKIINTFMKAVFARQDPNTIALGGSLLPNGIKLFSKRTGDFVTYKDDLVCIGFTKDNNKHADFNANSILLDSHSFEEEYLEKYFIRLKSCSILRKYGTAFRISCLVRSCPDKENKLYRKYFPNYPLLGFDGNGEIGITRLDRNFDLSSNLETPVRKKQKKGPKYTHMCCSVLVLLTWGLKLND